MLFINILGGFFKISIHVFNSRFKLLVFQNFFETIGGGVDGMFLFPKKSHFLFSNGK